jgi:hypothetical protein
MDKGNKDNTTLSSALFSEFEPGRASLAAVEEESNQYAFLSKQGTFQESNFVFF